MTLPCATSLSRVAAASLPSADPDKKPASVTTGHGGSLRTRMFGLFFLIVVCCAVGLISVASLIQQRDLQLHHVAVGGRTADGHSSQRIRAVGAHAADGNLPSASAADDADAVEDGRGNLSEYECVGWRAQRDCDPDGGEDPANDRACNETVHFGESGFCLVRHPRTGHARRVLRMHCDSLRYDVHFTCGEFAKLLAYGPQAANYVHDAEFSLAAGRAQLADDQETVGVALQHVLKQQDASTTTKNALAVAPHTPPPSFKRGVLFVVYEKLLESVFASVRALRALGCDLPVELWYKPSETNVAHPLLQALTRDFGCFLREIRDPRAAKFYTKIYAVYYSAFDQVLLLDSDNFAVRDPTYLFDSREFQETGALFWPDFWQPKKTIFNIQPTSFVWELLDLPFVDMFEQESGQVMVDRATHLASGALDALAYLAFHADVLERLRLVWGDKDLFRFAWMKANASFHMIATPPGAAGLKLEDQNIFCGVTMVQHGPSHEVVFLHRNQEKLSRENHQLVWRHVQQFKMGEVPIDQYDVRGANGGRYYPQFKRCYGKDIYYEKAFTVTPIEEMPFAELEPMLLEFVREAGDIVERARRARGGAAEQEDEQRVEEEDEENDGVDRGDEQAVDNGDVQRRH